VFALTKRRHFSYYLSLPFAVAIVFSLTARLADLQRAEIVAVLADQVAHHDTPEATAALRNLAAMPRPPLDILVQAATSADPEIAHEAQHLIDGLLRRWQRQIETERRVAAVARQLTALAKLLEELQPSFSRGDHRWLSTTARRILRLANRISSPHSPLVAVHCDAVLAAVAVSDETVAKLVNRDLVVDRQPVVTKVIAPVEAQKPAASNQVEAQRAFPPYTAFPSETSAESVHERFSQPGAREDLYHATPADLARRNEPKRSTTPGPAWSNRPVNASPAMPINTAPVGRGKSVGDRPRDMPTTNRTSAKRTLRPLADTESRELLHCWLTATGGAVLPLEEELTHRGFGRLSARLVEQLFSDDAEDRLRLVDEVLIEPGIDARPWLMLLADDHDADVRLLTVTIMATSNDSTLIEKAWQVAIYDRDPRIAGLADRLRDRRNTAERR
jgi:hypothetical protein